MNVYCEEAPGSVLFTDPAEDFGHCSLSENERTHFAELKDRYRQCRDRNRELVAQLSTLNSRTNKLNATEIHLRAKKLTKEDVQKYSRFDTLATTLCDQQDALDEAQQRYYDELVQSTSARIAQLMRNHEVRLEKEVRQTEAHQASSIANERLPQPQLRLQEQAQISATMIAELRKALQETSD